MSLRSNNQRRPSLSSPKSWLTRSSSSPTHSKPSTILSIKHRNFDSGVTVVRTPQEALSGSGVTVECPSDQEKDEEDQMEEQGHTTEPPASRADHHSETPSVPPAYSPPRSSFPLSKSAPSLSLKDSAHSTRSTRPPKHNPQKKLPPPPLSTLFPAVPSLPVQLTSPTTPSQFECVLLTPVSPNVIDFSKVLVTLETCTATHRTTFGSLTSRPSHLANYLTSLFSDRDDELSQDAMSSASGTENGSFNSIFHNHLAASGLLSQSTYHVHIFLDRASVSYDHILAYLRSPPTSIDHVASLPHAVQLHTVTPQRIEELLALRDEAAYLGLTELAQLCTAELRRIPLHVNPPQHTRTSSHSLTHTRGPSNISVRSMDTLRERNEDDADDDLDEGSTGTSRDSVGSAQSLSSLRGRGHTCPTASTTTVTGAAAVPSKERTDPSRTAPSSAPVHRRLGSQSRERSELIDVKPLPSLRGRSSNNWL